MKNTLYVKIFDNKKMYVGITNNFDRRMYQHQREAYDANSQFMVHKAMRKHSHTTEVWAENIDDRELIMQLEVQTISQLRELGIELYNMTDGGENNPILGMPGMLNPNSRPADYYELTPILRQNFRRRCSRMGWSFDDFEEILNHIIVREDGTRRDRYYTYKRKKEDW